MTYVVNQITNAGYEIKKIEFYSIENTTKHGVAFGSHKSENGFSFVTWECIRVGDAPESFFWGHYFSDKNAALKDFHQRLADGYDRHVKEE